MALVMGQLVLNSALYAAGIQNEEAKVTRTLRDAAKKGQKDVCLILAKEIIHSRKAVNKMYASKAQLNSVDMQMKNQLGTFTINSTCFSFLPSFFPSFLPPCLLDIVNTT